MFYITQQFYIFFLISIILYNVSFYLAFFHGPPAIPLHTTSGPRTTTSGPQTTVWEPLL